MIHLHELLLVRIRQERIRIYHVLAMHVKLALLITIFMLLITSSHQLFLDSCASICSSPSGYLKVRIVLTLSLCKLLLWRWWDAIFLIRAWWRLIISDRHRSLLQRIRGVVSPAATTDLQSTRLLLCFNDITVISLSCLLIIFQSIIQWYFYSLCTRVICFGQQGRWYFALSYASLAFEVFETVLRSTCDDLFRYRNETRWALPLDGES